MKIKYFFLILLISLSLIGCSREHTVILYNEDNDTTHETYTDVEEGSKIDLPVLEKDNHVFVGWSDEDDIYYKDIKVGQDMILTAVFEPASEVFEYDVNTDANEIYITGYTGDAKYLKIPAYFNDMMVKSIVYRAFENSQLIEVEIPKTISRINHEVFDGSSDLEKISFYGEYFGEERRIIYQDEYDELLEEFGDACTIVEEYTKSWEFSGGCPIKSVDDYQIIDGYEEQVIRYDVTVDLRWYEDDVTGSGLYIYSKAFSNLESLTTVEFPNRYKLFQPGIFYNTPSLINVTFTDSEYFETVDNIVYNIDDIKELIYYPAGLEHENFEIPSFVNAIPALAFHDNVYLKSITISEDLTEFTVSGVAFNTARSLAAINVESNNPKMYSIDGVLYGEDHTLIAYPVAKEDTEFIMPETTQKVLPYAFYGQKYLESITLSSNLEFLGGQSFFGVEKLKVLEIPSSVVDIGPDLTQNSSIETIIINRSYVEDGSFSDFRIGFYNNFPEIYVPDDSYQQYLLDKNWQVVGSYIHPMSELDSN